jgi:hypothetical protein
MVSLETHPPFRRLLRWHLVERSQGSLKDSSEKEARSLKSRFPRRGAAGVDENNALDDLLAAHADMQRLTAELAEARERRRVAARWLMDRGFGTSRIARQLGVTPQAVDGFVKYKDRQHRQ